MDMVLFNLHEVCFQSTFKFQVLPAAVVRLQLKMYNVYIPIRENTGEKSKQSSGVYGVKLDYVP